MVIADGGEVFGETANVAARVQGAAEPDTVVVTAATQRLVPGIFVLEDRGPQALKGVREPVPLYRVVQPSGVRSRLAVAAGRLTPFVGRDVELATLVERWERAVLLASKHMRSKTVAVKRRNRCRKEPMLHCRYSRKPQRRYRSYRSIQIQ